MAVKKTIKTIDKIGRVTSASVQKGTGRNWDQWIGILEKAGARSWSHRETVELLTKRYKLTPWWQQGVALGFEYHTGKKIEGQNEKGEYSVSVTKSIPMARPKLWKWLISDEGQELWLRPLAPIAVEKGAEYESSGVDGGIFGKIRTLKAPERIRLSWQEVDWPKPNVVQVHIVARPKESCLLVFAQEGMRDARLKETMRSYWRARAEDIAKAIAKPVTKPTAKGR